MSEHASRRRFLTTIARGAGAAPLARLFSLGPTQKLPAPAATAKRVLGQKDFAYLGAMRVPAQGVDMEFSYGTLTGRKVDGQVRLLMLGNVTIGGPLYEFADTGKYHKTAAEAPRMPLLKNWGHIFGSASKSWNVDGSPREYYPYPGALLWNESRQLLYWTYYDTYNVAGIEDWCLGASRLDPGGVSAFGPWRPSGEGRKGPWRCVRLAEHPLTGELLCGSVVMSGNASAPWGPDLWGGAFPNATTPSGFKAPDLPIKKYLTYYRMMGNVKRDGTFNGPLRSCRRPGDYVFEPILGGGILTEIDPQKNGGIGSWTQLDGFGGVVWLDLPDAHGVVFTGRLAAGHVWYRNAGQGNEKCTHGQSSPIDVTGPVSTAGYPALMICDPVQLNEVRAGQRTDYTVMPNFINAEAAYGVKASPISMLGSENRISGSYFDPATRHLYVCAPQADDSVQGAFTPLVHVFRVG